jgi:hypothetical protein
MLTSGIPLIANDLLFVVDGLAFRSPALADDPERLCAEIRRVIMVVRLMAANYDLTALQSGLCIAESLLLLNRPAEAVAVIYLAARQYASGGH